LIIAWLKTSLAEEIFFRGFIGKRLIDRLGFLRGNGLQSVIFAAVHVAIFGLLVDLWGFGPAWLGAGGGALVAALVVWLGCGFLAPEPAARQAPA